MPPSKRASSTPAKASPSKPAEPAAPVEQPCAEHFPDGFGEGLFSVGCEHGTWLAPPAEAGEDPQEASPPVEQSASADSGDA